MLVKSAPVEMFDDMLKAWQAIPRVQGSKLPLKASFSPAVLRQHLQNIGMAEYLGDGKLIIRLAGTNSREFWGEEVTGADYYNMPGIVSQEVMLPSIVVESVLAQPCGLRSLREVEGEDGNTWVGDVFSVPLCNEKAEPVYLLYGYRVFPKDVKGVQAWEPQFADLSSARLVGATFVDLGYGVPE